jgi:predicted transcriptional regulator
MKQLIIELDDVTAAELERVAPSRHRLRSRFVRTALRRALDAVQERRTAEAYRRSPDSADDWFFDATVWDEWASPRATRRR